MSAVVGRPPARVTVAEFLTWPDDGSGRRLHLVDGAVRAMSPASDTHGTIQSNVAYLVGRRLRDTGSSCRGRTEAAVVPRVRSTENLRVPDFAVSCAPSRSGDVVMPEPILLVEILSPSNEAVTRENVWAHTSTPSVREILVLRSTTVEAEVLRRYTDGTWPAEAEILSQGDELALATVDLRCALVELYAGTHLG